MPVSRDDLGRPRFGFSRYVKGPSLEIGPGVSPFPVPDNTVRILAERKFEGSIVDLFPELGPDAVAPKGDVYLDLDKDGLRQFPPNSLGSVIVSHVLEHTANPLRSLIEIHRVLRVGGRAIIALPDRRLTFDRARPGTSVAHLAVELLENVTEVSDDHIVEFCQLVEGRPLSEIDESLISHHRERSIHAHCWTAEEFFAAILFLTSSDDVQFDLLDFMGVEHSLGGKSDEEFVFVFEKTTTTSISRLMSQWADCLASNRITDVERIQHLAEIVVGPDSMLATKLEGVQTNPVKILATWLSHRDLRAFECPLVDPGLMSRWAVDNAYKDSPAEFILN